MNAAFRLAAAGLIAAAGLAVAQPALAASGTLVLYTSQLDADAQKTVDAFEHAQPAVKVQWVRSGTTEILNRLRAELAAGAPKPDVLLIADAVSMEGLKAQGRLMADPDAPVKGLPASTYDPDMTYFGTKLITTGIMYNTAAKMVPTSWLDLLKPEARNQVIMPSPLYSGAAAIQMAAFGEDPALGLDYFSKLKANGAQGSKGNGGVYKAVAGGDKLYGIVVDFLPIRGKLKGAPVGFVFPKEGVPAVTEPVAILKTAHNVEAAKAFVAFLLSTDGQKLAARQGFLPERPGVTPPAGFPPVAGIKLMPVNGAKALAAHASDKALFTKLFGG